MKKCRRYGTDCEVGFLCTVFLYHHSICEKDPHKEQFSFFTHLNVKTMFISSKALFKTFCEKLRNDFFKGFWTEGDTFCKFKILSRMKTGVVVL
jgi:hypothetical protein